MQKKKISQNVRLLISHGGTFLIAAAGKFLFADFTGYLLTAPAYQAIASLHRSDKTQGNRFYQHNSAEPSFANKGAAALQNLQHSTQAKEQRLAVQSSMQSIKRNAAGGAGKQLCFSFCCRRYPG